MIVIEQHTLKLFKRDCPIAIVIIFLEFGSSNIGFINIFLNIEEFEIAENCPVQYMERVLINLFPIRVNLEYEFPRLGIVLMQGSSRTNKLIKIYLLVSIEVNVSQYLACLFFCGL